MFGTLVAVVAALLFAARRTSTWIRDHERLRRTMTRTRIREVTPGVRVKISGIVELLGAPLHAPVSGRACAGFSASLYERDAQSGAWRRVLVEDEVEPFLVRDPSGVAVVRPRKMDVVWSVDHVREAEDVAHAERRWEEAALVAGEPVTVVGLARLEPDPTAPSSYRQMATRPAFDSAAPSPLFVVDGEAQGTVTS
ncbi:MAG: hypothetical protein ACXVDD_03760 [Polyangia bacterium]